MNRLGRLRIRVARAWRITSSFFLMGSRTALAYPINFVMSNMWTAFSVLSFYFVARFVENTSPSVGGDYFTFVVVGILVGHILSGSLTGFGNEVQSAVQQGRFEMVLVEPVRWRLLPFGLVQWPIASRFLGTLPAVVLAVVLGAEFSLAGAFLGLGILLLGVVATLAIGIFSTGIGVLSKRSDPFLALYTLAAPILAGALFPLDVLPGWIRWMSWLVPHTYILSAIRNAVMPGADSIPGPTIGQATLGLMIFSIVGYPFVLWFFGRVMEFGRKYGLLAGY